MPTQKSRIDSNRLTENHSNKNRTIRTIFIGMYAICGLLSEDEELHMTVLAGLNA